MKKLLMLLLITSVMTIGISRCTKTVTKTRFITNSEATDAVIDSLQFRLEQCDRIRKKCCDIVEENLIN